VRSLLAAEASHDLALAARDRFIRGAQDELSTMLDGAIRQHAEQRAQDLLADHARLRAAGGAPRLSVEAVLPPDVIGLFVLLPAGA
jgi:hypothetical protein